MRRSTTGVRGATAHGGGGRFAGIHQKLSREQGSDRPSRQLRIPSFSAARFGLRSRPAAWTSAARAPSRARPMSAGLLRDPRDRPEELWGALDMGKALSTGQELGRAILDCSGDVSLVFPRVYVTGPLVGCSNVALC